MMNSEIATSVMLGLKLVIVLLDNCGYGCIHQLQQAWSKPSRIRRSRRAIDTRKWVSATCPNSNARWSAE
jgi:TPP-dependent trihydroxycyclohexane-1,2-dione (THcHDO) dehydratase